jgi:outer membrane protein
MDDELSRITNQLKAGTNLPAAQRTNLAKQIEDKRIAMKRFAEDAEKEVGQARERELLALESSIKPVVEGVGKEMGLAAIFNKYESGLIYAADSVDITDAVIKRFNEATIARPRP